jgi:serine/threonine protein kinase
MTTKAVKGQDVSKCFLAPEQHSGDFTPGPAVDIWAFAAIMITMLSGFAPFHGVAQTRMACLLVDERAQPELPPEVLSMPQLARLLRRCFSYDPASRPTAEQALLHLQGMTSALDDVRGDVCTSRDSQARASAAMPKLAAEAQLRQQQPASAAKAAASAQPGQALEDGHKRGAGCWACFCGAGP